MKEKIKIVFMGSPDFAIPSLKAICDDDRFEILAVVTVPDKPAGRGQSLTPPPVKTFAAGKKLSVWQPLKLKEIKEKLLEAFPDLILVIAYGKLVPKDILSIPKYGCVNVHGSILPRYRGAAVLQAPILHGDDKTGISIILMDEGLDTGPIIRIEEIELNGMETAEDIHDALAELGAKTLPQTLMDLVEGKIIPQPQKGPSTYVKEIKKEDGKIDWSKPAIETERAVRAYTPWPGSYALFKDKDEKIKIIKILAARKDESKEGRPFGEIFMKDGRMAIQCGVGALIVTKLQLEGGKPMPSEEFLLGHRDWMGKKLELN